MLKISQKVFYYRCIKQLMAKVSQTGGTLLDRIVDIVIPARVVNFLNQSLLELPWIILNYWSFVHFFAGVGFYLLFPTRIWLWIIINIIFEIVEFILAFGGNPLFVEETVDIFWDIVLSVAGFLLAKIIAECFF